MNVDIYNKNRKRLIELYQIIQYSGFDLIVARKYRMTIEELENRETIAFHGSLPDTGHYNRPALIKLTIPMMIDIIPNLDKPESMGYKNPMKDSVVIYESIQEYINIWCNIIRECPEFGHPTIEELYSLESVAGWSYNTYQHYYYQKIINSHKDPLLEKQPEPIAGLVNMLLEHGAISSKKQDLSFVSSVDQLLEDKPSLKINYDNWISSSY